MHLPISVTQDELLEVLLQVAPVRPVFIWGAPGIGKSALVEKFADEVGLPCAMLCERLAGGTRILLKQKENRKIL